MLDAQPPNVREIDVGALDGMPLRATLFEPASPARAVIVSGATATPRGFYNAFASYLAQRGNVVLTYDYRGCGEPPAQLRRSTARMRDWGASDFAGTIDWMRTRFPELALHVVGHSMGGHALLMAPNNSDIACGVTVATQLGYWRLCAPGERYRVWMLLNLLAPVAMRLHGYVPGSRLGLGEDMAAGIMREWRRWCNSPHYFFDDPTMAQLLRSAASYRAPTLLVGLSDDPWATPAAIDAFAAHFDRARRMTVDAKALGLGTIGHFGFFRSRNGPALWPNIAGYLEAFSSTTPA
ncbi:MAG TPA: alpha/beta fold hydrolase [Candidatus Baltobacteraceae bacterium]|nr:alpha/beta fold hydrolase [Candidatus Baltobacteraceae bacterium]